MIEAYLWLSVNYGNEKWARLLVITKIAYNQASNNVFAKALSSQQKVRQGLQNLVVQTNAWIKAEILVFILFLTLSQIFSAGTGSRSISYLAMENRRLFVASVCCFSLLLQFITLVCCFYLSLQFVVSVSRFNLLLQFVTSVYETFIAWFIASVSCL